MAAYIPPLALAPASAKVSGDKLWAPASGTNLTFPPGGAWRSFAESDPAQIEAIARRFGGLTCDASTEAGEDLETWRRLFAKLRTLSRAWDDDGLPAKGIGASAARTNIDATLGVLLLEHHRDGGMFEVVDGQWAMRCLDMAHWWQLTAINDVLRLDRMARCRHCHTWFSLTGLRSDTGFCGNAHRSAFYQKRAPASTFWAELV